MDPLPPAMDGSTTRSTTVERPCALCGMPFLGFGDTCGTCRRLGRRGTVAACVRCQSYFCGFGALCWDCRSGLYPEDEFDSSSEGSVTITPTETSVWCSRCGARFKGFGNTCAKCRRLGNSGAFTTCQRCSGFFCGFGIHCWECRRGWLPEATGEEAGFEEEDDDEDWEQLPLSAFLENRMAAKSSAEEPQHQAASASARDASTERLQCQSTSASECDAGMQELQQRCLGPERACQGEESLQHETPKVQDDLVMNESLRKTLLEMITAARDNGKLEEATRSLEIIALRRARGEEEA